MNEEKVKKKEEEEDEEEDEQVKNKNKNKIKKKNKNKRETKNKDGPIGGVDELVEVKEEVSLRWSMADVMQHGTISKSYNIG